MNQATKLWKNAFFKVTLDDPQTLSYFFYFFLNVFGRNSPFKSVDSKGLWTIQSNRDAVSGKRLFFSHLSETFLEKKN